MQTKSLAAFIDRVKSGEPVSFQDSIDVITEHYDYWPVKFKNGLGEDCLINSAGTNEGSCKIFAFALLHGLNEQQTLNLFGDYYRIDVMANPDGTGHQNIRNFIRFGWNGIQFDEMPLDVK